MNAFIGFLFIIGLILFIIFCLYTNTLPDVRDHGKREYDSDKKERDRIAQRQRDAVNEADMIYKAFGFFKTK
jgi:hypothetical protein